MIKQSLKDVYYSLMFPLSFLLKIFYYAHFCVFWRNKPKVQVQVGCGKFSFAQWINMDANLYRNADYIMDVRAGLPFPDKSVHTVYSSHMMEHLYVEDAIQLLREFRRILAKEGVVRLVVPDFDYVHTVLKDEALDYNFPRPFKSRTGQAINYLFCDGQHRYAYSYESLCEIAAAAGFFKVTRAALNEDSRMEGLELHEPDYSLAVHLYGESA